MLNYTKAVVHEGRAHSDDFLSTCLLLYLVPGISIYRRSPTKEEFDDPSCLIIDQGLDFNPSKSNFDHHHLHENICAFTQLLDFFYGKQWREYHDWALYIETFDSSGPVAASNLIGGPDNLNIYATNSPIVEYFLDVFSGVVYLSEINSNVPGPAFYMKGIGQMMHEKIINTEKDLQNLAANAKIFEIEGFCILDITECDLITYNSYRLYMKDLKIDIDIVLSLNDRGTDPLRMTRLLEHFRFIPNNYCSFVHQNGFLCMVKKREDIPLILKLAEK